MKPIKPLYVLILVIVFAAAGFYGGLVYHKNQNSAGGGQFAGRFGGGAGRGNFAGGAGGVRPVSGQIVSQGNNSVTIKLPDGSSKIVDFSAQTTINKTTTGSAADLKSGEHMTVIGTTNSDGSVTAQTILIGNGAGIFRGQRNQAQPSGS